MVTGKKISEELNQKKYNTIKNNRDKKIIAKQKLVEEIKQEAHEQLLPTIKKKMMETTNLIISILKEKGANNVNSNQIMSLIAKKSMYEIATGSNNSYSSQEIAIAFNLYLEMINKINEIKAFSPTVESFCVFAGISTTTYENYRVDPEKKEIMDFIHSYLLGSLSTSALNGEVKEISAIYIQKTMGKVEQQAPTVVEYKKTANVDDIRQQINNLKRDKIIYDAEFIEEKDE